MFQRLHELSALFPKKELWQRINEGMPAEYNRQFALCFSEQGQWREVKTAILNESNHDDIIYRSGPSNGTDLTPCCKLATNTANRLLKAVKNLANYTHLPENNREQLQFSIQAFEEQADEIWQQVESKVQSSGIDGKTKRGFVCWVIGSQPVYEWEETKAFLTEQFLEPFAKGGIRQGNCLICGQSPTEVFGNFNILTCYNLDKRGSIAGGFVEKNAHRNFPVCRSCTVAVAEAFTFAENYLTSHMAGQSYMILPYASTPTIRAELYSFFQKNPERFQLAKACDLVSQELEWLDEFGEQGDQIALALIFFHAENNAWRIQAELQQILPSRLHELQRAAKKLADAPDLVSDFNGEYKPFNLTATTFKNFAGSWEKTSADTLRAWLVALFEKQPLDEKYFLHRLVSKIINIGKSKPEFLGWITRQAWGLYRYALLTELIRFDSGLPEKNRREIIVNSTYGKYVQEHTDFFNQPEKIVAFLTGCYAATVVATQKKARNATPFAKKFIGRLLSQTHLQRLYREGHDKLAQYDKLGYVIKGLDPDLAAAWIACGEHWNISDEEATFAFTIGYSLEYRIRGSTQDSDEE